MTNEYFFMGLPQDFRGLCKIYSPNVKETRANSEYPYYRQLLTVSYEELDDKWFEEKIQTPVPTPFQYLLDFCKKDPSLEALGVRAFEFFIHEPVTFLYDINCICIGNLEDEIKKIGSINELRLLNEENFFDFQNVCRMAIGENPAEPPRMDEDPRIKRIKRLGRKRDKVAAKKKGIDFGTSLAAICCMGLGLNPLNVGEISICAMYTLISTYQNKEKYEIDIRSLQAGADAKEVKPEYWIKN